MSDNNPKIPLALVVLGTIAVLTSAFVIMNMMHDFNTSTGAGVLGAGALIGLGLAARKNDA